MRNGRSLTRQQKLPPKLDDWLHSVAAERLADCRADLGIAVTKVIKRSEANLFFCDFGAASDLRSLCLKQFTHATEDEVNALFARSNHLRPALVQQQVASPEFIACNARLKTIAMTTESGESLEDLMVQSFYGRTEFADRCLGAIDNLAVSQAALNQSTIPRSASLASPCSNQEYVARIQEFLRHPFVAEYFADAGNSPESLLDRLPAEFWERHEKRLLHGDFQAKNVLVDDQCDIVMIDMDFGRGHPLFDVSQFLTQLVRLSRHWRIPRATRLLKLYGDRFVDGYCKQGFEYLRRDLPFFMLWAQTFSLIGDSHYPRPLRWYIKQHLRSSELLQSWGLTHGGA